MSRAGRRVGSPASTPTRESGAPVWLVVDVGGRRRGFLGLGRRDPKTVAVPLRECAAMPGRAWTAHPQEAVRAAPSVDPTRPLLREHEATICAHYGIADGAGRQAELSAHPDGAVTAQPA